MPPQTPTQLNMHRDHGQGGNTSTHHRMLWPTVSSSRNSRAGLVTVATQSRKVSTPHSGIGSGTEGRKEAEISEVVWSRQGQACDCGRGLEGRTLQARRSENWALPPGLCGLALPERGECWRVKADGRPRAQSTRGNAVMVPKASHLQSRGLGENLVGIPALILPSL